LTPQQEALLRKAARRIRSAKVLVAEGDYDSAVSRAYYAMFYVAEALLLSKGLAYSKHSAVIAGFGKEFAKEGALPVELHAHLREASDARNVADYQADSDLTEVSTAMHISRAERFVAVGEEILRRT
jgi:uncharacterized protein (UPF0332 family)